MDVRCPQCATTFEFDERQLRAQLVTLKCSVCQHLFRLELNLPVIQESQHRWMVRQEASGDILYFGGFDVLHQWIMQQRICAQDTISRTGARWTCLAEMGEFAPVFQVVESINALSRGRVESSPQPATPDRDRVGTMQQFVTAPPTATPQRAPQTTAPLRGTQPSGSLRAPQISSPQPAAPRMAPAATGPQRALPPRPQHPSSPPMAHEPLAQHRSPAPSVPLSPRQTGPNPTLPAPEPVAPAAPRTGPQQAVAEDQWTIGDLNAPMLMDAPPIARPRSRAPLIAVLLVLLIAGGVGAAFALGYLPPASSTSPAPEAVPELAQPAVPTSETALAPEAPPKDAVAPDAAPDVAPAPPSPQLIAALDASSAKLVDALGQAEAKAAREARRSDPKALAKDARRALEQEQYSKARELFHQSIQAGEATPENVTGLGWALIGMGNAEAAVAQFNKAIFLDEGFEDAYIGLGKAERQRGRLREAIQVYDRHLKRFPDGRKASISRYQREQLQKQLGEQ
jgi:predicted Zn finger-like uncharacterized protein